MTAAATLLALGALPAHAAQLRLGGLIEAVDETDCEPSPAELEDIAFIAEQDGIPLAEAIARYGWQTCFGEVTSYLSDTYSDQYAGAAIVEDGRRAWIAFKGEVPEEVSHLAEEIPVPVELVSGRGFSEVELNEILQSVYAGVSRHEEVATSNGSYDIETGVITIYAQPVQTLTDPDQRERLRGRLLPDQPVNTAITVDVIVVDELGGADESSDGLQGVSPALSGLLIVAVLALAVSMLIRRSKKHAR
ncbi:MAG TPA: hypothetical protein VMM14_00750 [Acidimicrobiia bacterium]|nr:hypothetical protein [Acidimicrobiia bacterium]